MSRYRRSNATGATFFFTVVMHRRQSILIDAPLRVALRDAVRLVRADMPFAIDAWVLLPDHLHCIWTLPPNDADFGQRWGRVKPGRVRPAHAEPTLAPARRHFIGPGRGGALELVRNAHPTLVAAAFGTACGVAGGWR